MKTYIDLFAGPGGLCTGFKNAGFTPLIAVEMSDNTVKTYARNHNAEIYLLDDLKENRGHLENILKQTLNTCLIHGDIREVDNEIIMEILQKKFSTNTVDVVAGGPPCESFSMAGKRAEGDERDNLFENMLRIAKTTKSKFVFFENVPGLLTKKKDKKKVFDIILEEFDEAGYNLASTEVDKVKLLASDYGVPQNRERVFLVGCRKEYGNNPFVYPDKTHGEGTEAEKIGVEKAFTYLPIIKSGEGDEIIDYTNSVEEDYRNGNISNSVYEYLRFMLGITGYVPGHLNWENNKGKITMHKAVNHRPNMVKRMSYIQQGEGMKKAADRLIEQGEKEVVEKYFPKKLYAARNRRLKATEPSFTVTSHCLDEMVHPFEDRGLTPRETARLQSFPDWYYFEGEYVKFHSDPLQDKYEQCGDAIPVLLVKALAVKLSDALDEIRNR